MDAQRPSQSPPSPLWAVLALSFLSSLGTGVVTTGIYFIAQDGYGFSATDNYLLGVVLGVTYIAGALAAGPGLRRLRHRFPAISTRAVLAALLALLGLLCAVPLLFVGQDSGPRSPWPIWALISVYSPLTGVLWPVIESFVSGGRTAGRLRSAIGQFNYTWAAALVLGFSLPYLVTLAGAADPLKHYPAQLIAALGLVHLFTLLLLVPLGREPGEHFRPAHEPHPRVFMPLLVTFRVLLPTSYIVLTALNPYLPRALEDLGVTGSRAQFFAATWTAARVVVFYGLAHWHGWHGRWYPVVLGALLMLAGFGTAVLAPRLGSLAAMIGGLAVFGVGMATIYAGALYYAMEIGDAEVEAGGKHEALIGGGYAVGPLCGLAAGWSTQAGAVSESNQDFVKLAAVGVIALGAAAIAVRRAWRAYSAS